MEGLTVLIPYYNGQATIYKLIDSIPERIPVVVVDDHSEAPYQPHTANRGNITSFVPTRKGFFSGAVNAGLQIIDGNVVVVNQDAYFTGNAWIDLLQEKFTHYGLIGERIKGDHPAWPNGYVHGTFMAMRHDAIKQVGLLDATHFPLWGSTADWQCRLARKGFGALALPEIPNFIHERDGRYGSSITQLLTERPDLQSLMIRTPPLVSVVVPCHNYGRYLPDAIHSLIGGDTCLGYMDGQTFQGFEIIIVNDASSDNTHEIARQYANPATGIRFITLPPSNHPDGHRGNGAPVAFNTGVEAANGKYVTVLSADDMMEPTRLHDMLIAQQHHPHSIIYDDMTVVTNGKRGKTWTMQDYDFERLIYKNHVHAGIMYPKTAWVEAGGYPIEMRHGREDWAFNIALGEKGYCGVHLPSAGYLYRRDGQNRTERNTTSQWMTRFTEQIRGIFPHLYQGVRPMGCCGKKDPNSNVVVMAKSLPPAPEGLTEITYLGVNDGLETWFGGATGIQYTFGGGRRNFYVDNRDLNWFLSQQNSTGYLFAKVEPLPVTQQIATVTEIASLYDTPQVETVVVESKMVIEEPQATSDTVDTVPFDPNDYTLAGLDDMLSQYDNITIAQIETMIEMEKSGRNRVGAITRLEAYPAI